MGLVLSIVVPFDSPDEINLALAALTVIDLHEMRRHKLPKLYQSGVRYQRDVCAADKLRETCNQFLTARQVLKQRKAACGPLSAYRAAELMLGGDSRARAFAVESPGVGWHCKVRHGDGRIECPSTVLGMK